MVESWQWPWKQGGDGGTTRRNETAGEERKREDDEEDEEEEGGESRRPKCVMPWHSGSHHSNLSWINRMG